MFRRPWLFLPSKWLYFLNPFFLKIYSQAQLAKPCVWSPFEWRGLKFSNPLGTAGGIDKNAEYIKHYTALGAGFLELGTVTPKAQSPNSGKILDRSVKHCSLWNNMGFPNKGLEFFQNQLAVKGISTPPLFINLGKNRQTPLESAVLDYKKGMLDLQKYASAFVINISSPNTKSLRELFDKEHLPVFLKSLVEVRSGLDKNIPLILKLSPDEEDWERVIEESLLAGIDGWCLTNSSRQRPVPDLFPEDKGGVSGRLLAPLSLNLLKKLTDFLKRNHIENKLVISCGGILSPEDVFERLDLGADLVQVYSALVFRGYGFFRSVYKAHSHKK